MKGLYFSYAVNCLECINLGGELVDIQIVDSSGRGTSYIIESELQGDLIGINTFENSYDCILQLEIYVCPLYCSIMKHATYNSVAMSCYWEAQQYKVSRARTANSGRRPVAEIESTGEKSSPGARTNNYFIVIASDDATHVRLPESLLLLRFQKPNVLLFSRPAAPELGPHCSYIN